MDELIKQTYFFVGQLSTKLAWLELIVAEICRKLVSQNGTFESRLLPGEYASFNNLDILIGLLEEDHTEKRRLERLSAAIKDIKIGRAALNCGNWQPFPEGESLTFHRWFDLVNIHGKEKSFSAQYASEEIYTFEDLALSARQAIVCVGIASDIFARLSVHDQIQPVPEKNYIVAAYQTF